MPGYHNDQFFRINDAGESLSWDYSTINNKAGYGLTGADNPPFIYPDRTIRSEGPGGQHFNTVLKRGYIRTLRSYAGHQVYIDVHKCQFQFNPATLTQVVEAASNTLDYLHLDPGQYAVPRSASVNFTFDLLFDRSMEMNNGSPNAGPSSGNVWETSDPSQVGVLRDLAAFYGVIGQSMRADQKQYMIQELTRSLTNEAAGATVVDGEPDTTQSDLDKALAQLPEYLDNNAANSAFLLPVPVRVVFSSLYMVEGFVTNTTVAFTKFNSSMVPMQCALSVTMEAKYIGFARANTFLTWALDNAAQTQIADEKAASDQVKALYTAFAKSASKLDIWLTNSTDDDASSFYMVAQHAYPYKIHGKYPNASDNDDDPVVKLFSLASPPAVNTQIQFAMYGPYDSSVSSLISASSLQNYVATHGAANGFPPSFVTAGMVNGQNSSKGHAGNRSEWKDMISGFRNDNWLISSTPYEGFSGDYDTANKWWIVNYKGTVQASMEGTTVEGTGESWSLHNNMFFPLEKTLTISWPDYAPVEETSGVQSSSGTVPPYNAATEPPASGTVSHVGAPKS